jgi:hypothetical protein
VAGDKCLLIIHLASAFLSESKQASAHAALCEAGCLLSWCRGCAAAAAADSAASSDSLRPLREPNGRWINIMLFAGPQKRRAHTHTHTLNPLTWKMCAAPVVYLGLFMLGVYFTREKCKVCAAQRRAIIFSCFAAVKVNARNSLGT